MKTLNKFIEKIDKVVIKLKYYFDSFIRIVVLTILIGILFRWLFEWTYNQTSWLLIPAIIFAFFFVYCFYQVIKLDINRYKDISTEQRNLLDQEVAGIFLAKLFLTLLSFSALSFLLADFKLTSYTVKEKLSLSILNDFYLWYAIDIIPGFEFCDTLNWERNIDPANFLSRFLVLLFKAFNIYIIYESIKKWMANRKLALSK